MLVLAWVGALWAIYIVDFFLVWFDLEPYGVRPRELGGVVGIAIAPFVHGSFFHLLANTLPLTILGWVLALSGRKIFLEVAAVTAVTSGVGAWLFGAGGTVHVGASGVLFGLLGFLLARGWFARRVMWSLTAAGVGLFYLGTIFSLLTAHPAISWSSHFWGFTGGIAWAWWRYGRGLDRAREISPLPKVGEAK
jgi:membrane associated rhomboid family serine protease